MNPELNTPISAGVYWFHFHALQSDMFCLWVFQGAKSAAIPERLNSKQGCISIADSCVGLGCCIEKLLHSGVQLNTTHILTTLPNPMDVLTCVKNVFSEMSINRIISLPKYYITIKVLCSGLYYSYGTIGAPDLAI